MALFGYYSKDKKRDVALVLSGGGARGYAHIGAIEEIEEQGYAITSVAGTSMGALIGGMYAAGKLREVKEWLYGLKPKDVFSLVDWSIGMNHLIKGARLMEALKTIVPDVLIEDLPIPFTAIAADVKNHEEVVISSGSLYEAIRASISIPSFLKPVTTDGRVLVDGGVVNQLPLNRVRRKKGDILIAVNVSAAYSKEVEEMKNQANEKNRKNSPLLQRIIPTATKGESNYVSLLVQVYAMLSQQNSEQAIVITPPDVLASVATNRFGCFDFDKAERISNYGREKMRDALEEYHERLRKHSFIGRIKGIFR